MSQEAIVISPGTVAVNPNAPLDQATIKVEGTTETVVLIAKIDADGRSAIWIRREDGSEEPYQSRFRGYVGNDGPGNSNMGTTNDLYFAVNTRMLWQRINGVWVQRGIYAVPSVASVASPLVLNPDTRALSIDLGAYALKTDLSGLATTASLSGYATNAALSSAVSPLATKAYVDSQVGGVSYTPQVQGPITYSGGKIGFDGSGFVTTGGLTTALQPYALSSSLAGLVSSSSLATTLQGYVTSSVLSTAIAGVTLTFTGPLSKSGTVVSIPAATASVDGYMPATAFADLQTAKADIATLKAQGIVGAIGVKVQTLTLGLAAGSVDVVVPIAPTMPSATYTALAAPTDASGVALGGFSTKIKSQTATTITVTLTYPAITLLSSVTITAIALRLSP